MSPSSPALLARSGESLAQVHGVDQARGPRAAAGDGADDVGAGSEVTAVSIVTTGEGEKKGVVSPILLPDLAVLDPELTVGLPPRVTAATGIDAMVHAIDAHTTKRL